MMKEAIGIFDSGVGGLTVAKEIIRQLPHENIIYFGDTARVPYGTKSGKLITKYAVQDAGFLMSLGIKVLVVACNTVSAISLEKLTEALSVPVVGVIEPGCQLAVRLTRRKRIGVIGTETTIASGIYPRIVRSMDSRLKVFSKACPLLVPLVEEGLLDGEITRLAVSRYLRELKGKIDTLIPGCTHYPLLKPVIQEEMGKETVIVDSAVAVGARVKELLSERGLLSQSSDSSWHKYFVSDDPGRFRKMAELFLGEKTASVEEIDIEQY